MEKDIAASAMADLARFEIETLDRIRETMLSGIATERRMIERLGAEADAETLEDLSFDDHLLREAEELVGKLLIVGHYRLVENLTKQALRFRFSKNKVQKCYQIEKLKKVFTDDLQADLTDLPEFAAIDELRDLNNKVKHGGKMPEPALVSYERLRGFVGSYLANVAHNVVP